VISKALIYYHPYTYLEVKDMMYLDEHGYESEYKYVDDEWEVVWEWEREQREKEE
jgi:hypothetical protein